MSEYFNAWRYLHAAADAADAQDRVTLEKELQGLLDLDFSDDQKLNVLANALNSQNPYLATAAKHLFEAEEISLQNELDSYIATFKHQDIAAVLKGLPQFSNISQFYNQISNASAALDIEAAPLKHLHPSKQVIEEIHKLLGYARIKEDISQLTKQISDLEQQISNLKNDILTSTEKS